MIGSRLASNFNLPVSDSKGMRLHLFLHHCDSLVCTIVIFCVCAYLCVYICIFVCSCMCGHTCTDINVYKYAHSDKEEEVKGQGLLLFLRVVIHLDFFFRTGSLMGLTKEVSQASQ